MMSIKIALSDSQSTMDKVRALIKAHPQGDLFEVSCFSTTKELLAQSVVYDLLITGIQKDPEDTNGLELAEKMSPKTKIVIFSYYSPRQVREMMQNHQFEIFQYIRKEIEGYAPEINYVLEKYLQFRENTQQFT